MLRVLVTIGHIDFKGGRCWGVVMVVGNEVGEIENAGAMLGMWT